MLEHALQYARKGWYIIPCYPMRGAMCACNRPQCVSPGKHPANQRGLSEATTDEAQIRAWWAEMPDASIGVVCEPSKILAFDLDVYHSDMEKLAVLEQTLGPLPATVTQISGSKEGYHTVFESPGFPVRGVIGGIVVRSKAYIIVAPSNHKSGSNYEWHPGLSPGDIAVATLPDTWKEALRKSAEVGQVGVPNDEPEWLAKIPEEKRIADMKAHFARESGEVKGTSLAGTTFNIVRSAIRSHAVRDPEAALEAAMEFDAKCVPPWGARMARHVWSAYQRAYEPQWGVAYRGEEQRLEDLGLNDVPVLPAIATPPDIVVLTTLESLKNKRPSEAEKLLDKRLIIDYVLKRAYLGGNEELAAQALVRNCPPGTTDDQIAGYLIACMLDRDAAFELVARARAALRPASGGMFDDLPVDGAPTSTPSVKQAVLGMLKVDTEGEGVKDTPSNINKILMNDPKLGHNIRFNELTKQVEIRTEPFNSVPVNCVSTEILNYLDNEWQLCSSGNKVEAQLIHVARKNPYNPIADYLRSLVWDGVERLPSWLIDYCGAEDTEFNRRIGTMWMIAACARGVKPGSKVDTVLVLEGIQGAKKSTALSILAGPWFSDTPLVIGNKDSMQMASYRWIIELAELSSLRVSETEAQKAFISAKVDNYRPPYGKAPEEFPRFAIFGGSTNEDEYLPDATGNRRYWPCRVDRCDDAALRIDRDQLWAEAYYRYMSAELSPEYAHPQCPGERWWFETEAEQIMAATVVNKRRPENVWVGLIKEWSKRGNILGQNTTRRQWTLAEIAKNALDIEIEKMPSKQKGITAAIKEAGLRQVTGPEGQIMYQAQDPAVTDEVSAGVVTTGLPNSN